MARAIGLVAAIEVSSLAVQHPERHETWKAWALGHADRIDPLRSDAVFDQEVSDDDVHTPTALTALARV